MCIGSNSVNQAQDLISVTKFEDFPNSLLPSRQAPSDPRDEGGCHLRLVTGQLRRGGEKRLICLLPLGPGHRWEMILIKLSWCWWSQHNRWPSVKMIHLARFTPANALHPFVSVTTPATEIHTVVIRYLYLALNIIT